MRPDFAALVIAFLGGFLGTFVSTDLVRRFAVRLGAVDHPGGRRVHRAPTARLGGLAIAVGLCSSVAIMLGHDRSFLAEPLVVGSIGAIAVALAVGVIDDLRGLGAVPKLIGQTAAALLLWTGGWRLETIGLPGLGALDVGALSLPLTILWVVGVINAVNLIDGLDGLAGGLAVVFSLACAWLLAAAGDPTWILAVALAGAVAGFLWFNLSPALIFMGDAGSHLLGILLAALGLHLSRVAPPGMFPLVPLLLLAVPICDMAWAIARRATAPNRAGDDRPRTARAALSRVVRADGAHVHHRLLQAGWTPRGTVGLLWRAAAACAVVGVTLAGSPLVAMGLAAVVMAWMARVAVRAGAFDVAAAHPVIAVIAAPVLELIPEILPAEPEEIAA